MAWVRRLPSGKYAGRYRDHTGRERTAPGGPYVHKAAAMRAAADAETTARAPGWRAPDAARQTWGTWCEQWWPTRTVEASTLRADTGRRDLHLTPRWGDVPLADITRHDIRAWAAQLRTRPDGTPRSPATVQRIVHLLSASLAAAVDAEVLAANPAARLRLTPGEASHERYLTREEFAAVLERLERPEHQLMARLLAGTGLRWGEAAGLHHARVDPGRGVLEVAEVWSIAGRVVKAYPKGRRRRHVPVPAWVELPDPAPGEGACGYAHAGGAPCRSGLVVTTAGGAVLDESRFRKAWDRACAAAGVGHVRPHDLRHTYASWLLQDGVPLAEVGRLLGHVSPTTTQRYAHLAESPDAAVLAALRDPRRGADVAQRAAESGHARLSLIIGGKAPNRT